MTEERSNFHLPGFFLVKPMDIMSRGSDEPPLHSFLHLSIHQTLCHDVVDP